MHEAQTSVGIHSRDVLARLVGRVDGDDGRAEALHEREVEADVDACAGAQARPARVDQADGNGPAAVVAAEALEVAAGAQGCRARQRGQHRAPPQGVRELPRSPQGVETLRRAVHGRRPYPYLSHMRARAVGVNHVALEVGDIDDALAWYEQFL